MEIEQVERKLENMHFDSIVKSYCNKENYIKILKAENKELKEQLRLHGVVKSFSAEQIVSELKDCETLDDAIMYCIKLVA